MATGPEHYRKAEELDAAAAAAFKAVRPEAATFMARRALIHATLALAAATAMSTDMGELDFEAWDAVCGVQEEEHDEDDGDHAAPFVRTFTDLRSHDAAPIPVEYHIEPAPSDIPAPEGRI
jgi:hypothetical protein